MARSYRRRTTSLWVICACLAPVSAFQTQQRTMLDTHEYRSRRTLPWPSPNDAFIPVLPLVSSSMSARQGSLNIQTQPRRSTARLLSLGTMATSIQSSLHSNPSYCLTALLLLGTFGISLEQTTRVGKALSAPLATMALALVAANAGVIPFASPMYSMVNTHLVGLAVPMLLMDSNQLRRLFTKTNKDATSKSDPNLASLLAAFCVGTIGTLIATVLVYPLIPLRGLSPSSHLAAPNNPALVGWKIACALAARHIGGAINFVAVAETLSIPGTVVSAAIAADNVVVALYFALLFALAKPDKTIQSEMQTSAAVLSNSELEFTVVNADDDDNSKTKEITLSSIGMALSTASALVTVGGILTKAILPKGTSSLPLSSLLTVAAATMCPKYFSRIRAAGSALGILAIQLFFAASGAAGSIALVLQQAPSLFAFSALQIGIHFGILVGVGRGILRLPSRELYLASNACVGGPTTAAAMATAKEWKQLILPALWIGILGYAIATALALAMGPLLLRLPLLR